MVDCMMSELRVCVHGRSHLGEDTDSQSLPAVRTLPEESILAERQRFFPPDRVGGFMQSTGRMTPSEVEDGIASVHGKRDLFRDEYSLFIVC